MSTINDRLCAARTRPQARRRPDRPGLVASAGVGAGIWILSALWLLGWI